MTEMIERVARAIVREKHRKCCLGAALDDVCALPLGDESLAMARAAIEAMREPTEDMIAAGIAEANICTADQTASAACVPEHAWPKMIDAALAVSESTDRSSINVPNQENQPS